MDLGSALLVLSPESALLKDNRLSSAGMAVPVTIPWNLIPLTEQERILTGQSQAPPELVVKTLLNTGKFKQCWTYIRDLRGGLGRYPAVITATELWAAQQLAELKQPLQNSLVHIYQSPDLSLKKLKSWHERASKVQQQLRTLTRSLPWPYWTGPVVFKPAAAPAILHSDGKGQITARPCLPVCTWTSAEELTIDEAAQLQARLLGDLAGSSKHPLPDWFVSGLGAVVATKVQGWGPSPKAMLERRQASGLTLIRQLLTQKNPTVDKELAKALVAPLCHTNRRHHLPSFLDLLRNGSSALRALELAYELTPERLLSER